MFHDFRRANLASTLTRAAQVALSVSLLVLVNWISLQWYARLDLSADRRFSLSAETLAYLRVLPAPIEVYLAHAGDSADEVSELVMRDLENLLGAYQHAASVAGRSLQFTKVDVLRQHSLAQELTRRFKLADNQRNVLVVASGERFHRIEPGLLYDQLPDGTNQFTGERAVTSAIMRVTEEKQPVAYFLVGHGELDASSADSLRGMSIAATYFKDRNWRVESLTITPRQGVPEDAALLVIAGPQQPLLPLEATAVQTYLDQRQGRVLLLVDPAVEHGLDELLFTWGLRTPDAIVVETDADSVLPGGDLIISRFGPHPITDFLYRGAQRLVFGLTRPVLEDLSSPPDATRRATALLGTSDSASWAESGYRRGGPFRYDRATDLPGPVSVAAAVSRVRLTDLGGGRPAGRLVVVGSSSPLSNQRLAVAGNLLFLHQVVGWLTEADEALLQIQPRQWKPVELTLSEGDRQRIWLQLAILPAAAFLAAGAAALVRRR